MYYTIDGTDPTASETRIETTASTTLTLSRSAQVRAVETGVGFSSSPPVSATYTILGAAPTSAPQISPTILVGSLNVALSSSIIATGNPISYSAAGLPSGLSLNTTNGLISGTPTAAGLYSVSVTATNSVGTGSAVLVFNIVQSQAPPVISSATNALATSGSTFAYQITASNLPTLFGAIGLPAGLTFNSATGVISGTATNAGDLPVNYEVTLSAINSQGTGTGMLTLTVEPSQSIQALAPQIATPTPPPATEGQNFTYPVVATGATTYSATGLPSGLSINSTTGVISGTPGLTSWGSYFVVLTATGSGGSASVPFGLYVSPNFASITSPLSVYATVGSAFSYVIASSLNSGGYSATPDSSSGWLTYDSTDNVLSGTPTQIGDYTVALTAGTAPVQASGTLIVHVTNLPEITSALTASANVGTPFAYGLQTLTPATSYTAVPVSASSFPPGLSFDFTHGYLTGTPTATGTYQLNVGATGSSGSASAVLTLSVSSGTGPAEGIISPATFYGTLGQPLSYAITANNQPTSFSISGFPAWVSCNMTTGTLSGTPPAVGVFYGTVNAMSTSNGTASAPLSIVIGQATGNGIAVTTQFQDGVVPNSLYSSMWGTIAQDPSQATTAGTPFTELSVGNPGGGTQVNRALLGFPLINIPGDAIITGISLKLNAQNAGSNGATSTVNVYQASQPFTPNTATWNILSGDASPLSGLQLLSSLANITVPSATTLETWTSSAAFIAAAQNALSSGSPLYLEIASPTAESTAPTNPSQYFLFEDESNATSTIRPLLSVSYITHEPPIMAMFSPINVMSGTSLSYQVTSVNGGTYTGSGLSGLSINSTTGLITGTPSSSGTFLVTATNGNGSSTQAFVVNVGPVPSVSGSSTATGTINSTFNCSFSATNNPIGYSLSGYLPSGLVWNGSTGTITGTPALGFAGSYSVTITATNVYGTSSPFPVMINIYPLAPVITGPLPSMTGNQGVSFSGSISARGQPSGFTLSSNLTSLGLQINSGGYISNVSGGPTTIGTVTGWVQAYNMAGSTTQYSAQVPLTITINALPVPALTQTIYAVQGVQVRTDLSPVTVGANSSPVSASNFSPSGILFDNLSMNSSGFVTGTPSQAGTFQATVSAQDAAGTSTGQVTCVVYPVGPGIEGPLTGIAQVGIDYNYVITPVQYTAYYFSCSGLPPGLSLNYDLITGIPTQAGNFPVTLNVSDGTNTSTATLMVTVLPASAISSGTTATATVGSPFSFQITDANSPASFAANGLPADGLSLNSTSGVISGTPLRAGLLTLPLQATDSVGTAQATLNITINPNPSDSRLDFQAGMTPSTNYSMGSASIVQDPANAAVADESFGSSGTLSVGEIASPAGGTSANSRGLLSFNVSAIPMGATITSASLLMKTTVGTGNSLTVQLNQTGPFDPNASSWSANAGCATSVLATANANPAQAGTISFLNTTAFAQAVQQAVRGSAQTLSMAVSAPGVEGNASLNYVNFVTQATDPTQNPHLIVTYTFPNQTPVITSGSIYQGTVNVPVNYQISATNIPANASNAFSVTNLPSYLSLNPTTGQITGTSSSTGTVTVGVQAANSFGTSPSVPVLFNFYSATQSTGLGLISGNYQSSAPGIFLPLPLVVQASTSSGPLAGTLVTFSVPNGALSTSNTGTPTATQLSVATDTSGNASVYLYLPSSTTNVSVEASAGMANPVWFTESAVANPQLTGPGNANDFNLLSVVSGDAQSGPANQPLPQPFVVQAIDDSGHAVTSLNLSLAVMDGGGSVSGGGAYGATATVATDSNGRATAFINPGSSGTTHVSCTSGTSTITLTGSVAGSSTTTAPSSGIGTNPLPDGDPTLQTQAPTSFLAADNFYTYNGSGLVAKQYTWLPSSNTGTQVLFGYGLSDSGQHPITQAAMITGSYCFFLPGPYSNNPIAYFNTSVGGWLQYWEPPTSVQVVSGLGVVLLDANQKILSTVTPGESSPMGAAYFIEPYEPPTTNIVATPTYNYPIDEASGPRYRKIALTGLPMSDEKPSQSAETDQEKEETYVDALTVGLRHSTTDIYMPISGSDLALSARRDFRSQVWNMRHGLRPHEQPDLPFGACWSSNLAPNIRLDYTDDPNSTSPPQAYVTDEGGGVHTFIQYNNGGQVAYFPMPSAKNEQQPANLETLTVNLTGPLPIYTFTRKFGTTLTYQGLTITMRTSEDRSLGSNYHNYSSYARLIRAQDRIGNVINYTFQGPTNLIPSRISVANQPALSLSIQQSPISALPGSTVNSSQSVITAIWDANGNETQFNYIVGPDSSIANQDLRVATLTSVTAPDGTVTQYSYGGATQTDPMPHPVGDPGSLYVYADIASIRDPLLHTYSFSYTIDNSKWGILSAYYGSGPYREANTPRVITSIALPDGTSHVNFDNSASSSELTTSAGGEVSVNGPRKLVVTDANGCLHTYRYGSPVCLVIPHIPENESGNASTTTALVVAYQRLDIDYGSNTGQFLGTEEFWFDPNSAMALSSVMDFSGNWTTYSHGDKWTAPPTYAAIQQYFSAPFNGNYDDPTAEAKPIGTKRFTYDRGTSTAPGSQIMTDMYDEDNNHTHYGIDSLGRRTSEVTSDVTGRTIQETDFVYGDGAHPGVITSKTVKSLGTDSAGNPDPSWTTSLVTQYVPDANGRVAQETVAPGTLNLTTLYSYDANGNKLSSTDPKGHSTWFSYDSRNRLITVTYADGSQKQMGYDARGNKIIEYDENGIATIYKYDPFNRLQIQARDMNGNGVVDQGVDLITTYNYDNPVLSKLTITNPNGNVTQKWYDSLQRLTQLQDAAGNVTKYAYGANSGGNAFDSSSFHPTETQDPRPGIVTDVQYDGDYRATNKSVTYDQKGDVSSTSMSYDAAGNLMSSTDPVGNTTSYYYDGLNRLYKTAFADTSTSTESYTSTGLKYQVTDENGNQTLTQYDDAGRPILVTQPLVFNGGPGATATPLTKTFYDAAGNVEETVNPRNYAWDFVYDARNRKVQEFAPNVSDASNGNAVSRPTTTWSYDPGGRLTSVTDPRGNQTTTLYDPANRVTDVNSPPVPYGNAMVVANTHTTYDFDGNIVTLRDPDGNTTANHYDQMDRLSHTVDAAGITGDYQYDQVGNRQQVTDGKTQTTYFQYDGLNRNTKITDFAGNSTTFTYNGLNKTQRVDALQQSTAYFYDLRNRLQNVIYASTNTGINSSRTYSYDYDGNIRTVSEPGKAGVAGVAYTYDALNRISTETSSGITHQYYYDLAGNRVQTLYGKSGVATPTPATALRTITSFYDPLNRLQTMQDQTAAEIAASNLGRTTGYGYDLNGNIAQRTLPNGDSETYSFDSLNRTQVESAQTGGAVPLFNYTYGYDPDGNVLVDGESYPSGLNNRTVTNTYDGANRLLTETVTGNAPNVTTTYAYDNANNRSSMAVATGGNTVTTTYNYYPNGLNQLWNYSDGTRTVTLTYDLDGNRSSRTVTGGADSGTDTYSYDFENRLVSLAKGTVGSAGTYNYSYDYRTRRVVRDETQAAGVKTQLVFSGGTSVQEYTGSATGTPVVEYLRGSDYGGGVGGILYTMRSGTASYTHENRRGDVVAKTDGSGSLTYQAQYQAFGSQTQTSGTTLDRQKSNSKDTDPTGLVDEGMRYRDLDTGMFITRDPAGMIDGPNLYTYVIENPWTKFDPEGLADEEVTGSTEDDIEETGAGLRNNDPELDEEGKPIFGSEEYQKENPPSSQAPSGPTVGNGPGQIPPMNLGPSLLPPQGPPKTDDEIAQEVAKEMEAEKSNTPGSETQKQETDDNKEKTGASTSPAPTKPDAKPIDSTRPQHGTSDHDATAFNDAQNKQNTPGNSDARFNQQLTDTKGNAVPGYRPDSQVTRTQPDGTQVKDVTEVQSRSQSDAEMAAKREAMTKALGSEAGNIQVIKPSPGATRNTSPPPANPQS